MLKLSELADGKQAAPYPAPITSWDDFAASSYLLTIKGAPEIVLPHCGYMSSLAGGMSLTLMSATCTKVMSIQEWWVLEVGKHVID